MINRRKEAAQGFLYILPSLVLILVFSVVPILMSLYFSFTKYNVLQPPQWTGLDNYIRLFRDPYVRALAEKHGGLYGDHRAAADSRLAGAGGGHRRAVRTTNSAIL